MTTRLTVNGLEVELSVPGMRRLLDVLREELGLTGTKEGCGEGECGACTVLLDGEVVVSCLVPVCQAEGHEVRTVEGLAPGDGRLDVLQQAFLEAGGAQCGICTPGMLMAAEAFLEQGGAPTEDAIREAIAGNLCRCTGYTKIIDAIRLAALARNARHGRPGPGTAVPPGAAAPEVAAAPPDASVAPDSGATPDSPMGKA
jgi:aerobic carbon-monoxide dehydrogenase small subunit